MATSVHPLQSKQRETGCATARKDEENSFSSQLGSEATELVRATIDNKLITLSGYNLVLALHRPRHSIGLINQFAIVKVNTQLIHH